jgi:sugar transferase (PEP-CTERM/EpsH1 system associated)
MKILFITARLPYPPLRGDQVRAYNQLIRLGQNHQITLVSFATQSQNIAVARQQLEPFCSKIVVLPLHRFQVFRGALNNIGKQYPFQTLLYQTPQMAQTIDHLLEMDTYDLAHVQLARMAPYLEQKTTIPRIIDLIDALSLNMKRRYDQDRGLMRWVAYLEWRRMRHYEQAICRNYDRILVVSQVDHQAIGAVPNAVVNANGVSLKDFSFNSEHRDRYTLVFSGNMGYFPNINAVLWFVSRVWPTVKQAVPEARFYVVGDRPDKKIRQLSGSDPSIVITGFVPDISESLKQATVAVAPMQAGSGIQNKVLEAMACGVPVVATPYALGGIAATDGDQLLVATEPAAFAASVVRLLQNPSLAGKLAGNARRLVESRYTWTATVRDLEAEYQALVT